MSPPRSGAPQPSDIGGASIADALASLGVRAETGLNAAEVDIRRKSQGYNEVVEEKPHAVRAFLAKFWGISAWMLELIIVLSVVLRNYADVAVVAALLIINAVLGFAQERRAAGVVAELRRRLQVTARVRRDSAWQAIPARELVAGDIVRVRPGDIVPADVKLLSGALSIDESALTGESANVEKSAGAMLASGSVVRRGEGDGLVALIGAATALGRRSSSYVASNAFPARPVSARSSFHARLDASRIPAHIPWPANGGIWCAASPARNARSTCQVSAMRAANV